MPQFGQQVKYKDTGNSTEIALGVSESFIGQWVRVSSFISAIIVVVTDQNTVENGMLFESSLNGVDVLHSHSFSPLANVPFGHHYPTTLDSEYFRIVYTNGSVAQTIFRLISTLFRYAPEECHVHPVEFQIDSDHPASISRSILVAKNPAGGYGNIGRTTGGSLRTSMEEHEDAVKEDIKKYLTGSGANGLITLTSADTAYAVPASAPSGSYRISIQNNSDESIFIGYQNTNSNGIELLPGDIVSDDLGAGQQLYVYCASDGKTAKYTTKLVN